MEFWSCIVYRQSGFYKYIKVEERNTELLFFRVFIATKDGGKEEIGDGYTVGPGKTTAADFLGPQGPLLEPSILTRPAQMFLR